MNPGCAERTPRLASRWFRAPLAPSHDVGRDPAATTPAGLWRDPLAADEAGIHRRGIRGEVVENPGEGDAGLGVGVGDIECLAVADDDRPLGGPNLPLAERCP